MTYQFNVNITPVNGHDAVFQWKQFMVSHANWTVVKSSDGTTTANSDVITSYLSGAGGLGNNRSWFVIQQPSSTLQFCFQNMAANSGNSWRIKYSPSGFVNGGTATVTPTANISTFTGIEDAGVILGSAIGTDASPGGQNLFSSDGTYHLHMMADDAAPNGFYFFTPTIALTQIECGFVFDPLAASTFPAGDTDPYLTFTTTFWVWCCW